MSFSKMNTVAVGGAILLTFVATGTRSWSQVIPIENAGFEAETLQDDEFSWDLIGGAPGWEWYDPENRFEGANIGAWNPPAACYPNEAPEGLNVGWVYWGFSGDGYACGMQQALQATLEAGKTYTLTAMVGNGQSYWSEFNQWFYEFDGFPGYRIELVAGDTVVAVDDDSVTIAEGTFEQATTSYTVLENDPLIGEVLTVRLINKSADVGYEVDFDDVRLVATGSGYTCSITGNCPGSISVNWAGATPNKTQGIVFASDTGNYSINSGPCSGTQLGLGTRNLQLVRTIGTGGGSGSVNGSVGTAACGGYIQLVTASGSPCETSTVGQIP